MGALNFRKGVNVMHLDIKAILLNEAKQFLRVARELLPRTNVSEQRRPHQAHVLGRQARNGDGRDGARGIAEGDHAALERDALETQVERRFPHAVEDGHAPLASC
ncbi:hypothetical protein RRF57_000121 [Xylaria bambusicola]|uniref:Uncharacterized protein n=1 Tax=Xylaria bambusicola TaxID=326684 RepID=A0AAN7U334_9PEZI